MALGFKSWPDYIADVARTEMPNVARSVEQRRQIVELLAGEGMSNRAIAEAVGVNEITVRRDKDEVRHDVAPADRVITDPMPVTGLDGKTYKPKQPKPQPKPQPEPDTAAEITDPAPSPDPADTDDAQTLWSPDVMVTVTKDVDYCDLREWAISLYRHAVEREEREWNPHNLRDPDGAVRLFAYWLDNPDDDYETDVFGATFLRLSPYILIGEMATWLATECDVDGIKAMEQLIAAYSMWCYRLDKAFKESGQQELDGTQ